MTLQLGVASRNAMLNALETALGTSPLLRVYTGSAPANCAAAATGTLLAECTLPSDWMANASSGTKALSGTWQDLSANNTGTAAYFRLVDSTGTTCEHQGTVGVSSTDMIVDSVSFTAGQSFTVTSYTLTAPNA